MTNWTETFESLPSDELDKLAVLRLLETSNGICQFKYRDKEADALTIDETRKIMGFSMSSIKRYRIMLENETIEFGPETKEIMAKVREIYIKGMKHGDDEAYADFLVASLACLIACGLPRLEAAKNKLFADCYAAPPYVWQWGMDYCRSFIASSYNKETAD